MLRPGLVEWAHVAIWQLSVRECKDVITFYHEKNLYLYYCGQFGKLLTPFVPLGHICIRVGFDRVNTNPERCLTGVGREDPVYVFTLE